MEATKRNVSQPSLLIYARVSLSVGSARPEVDAGTHEVNTRK